MNKNTGILYVVSTPIGNLEDITFRAIRMLKEVDLIASEDTRHSSILLTHYGITTPKTSFFKFNQNSKIPYLINLILEGKNIALISDAGTPGISDPGYEIIKEAITNNIAVIPIPGATALISSLIVSGLPTNKFTYEGFLSSKQSARRKELSELKNEKRTMVFYESPHRLKASLRDILDVLGNRYIVLAKEITKKFEQIIRDNVETILNSLPEIIKGEYVIIIEGQKEENLPTIDIASLDIKAEIEKLKLEFGIDKKEAMKKLSEITGIPKKEIYKKCISE